MINFLVSKRFTRAARSFSWATAFCLLWSQAIAAAHTDINAAIQSAIDDPAVPFELDTHCSDKQSRRALTVFRGTTAIWNGQTQILLGADDRRALLELLLASGFSEFDARYGEAKKADKQEAPLRVSCRVHLTISGLTKSSLQEFMGEASPGLLDLAHALLDRVEPLSESGTTAVSLEDGLNKLADGVLLPEMLELRLLDLPDDAATAGVILRVSGGDISRQQYRPGKLVGDVVEDTIDECSMRNVVAALREAEVWNLPRNLKHAGTAELDVSVLGHRHNTQARTSYARVDGDLQSRFEQLLSRLETLETICP